MSPWLLLALFSSTAAHAYQFKKDKSGKEVRWHRDVELFVDAQLDSLLGAEGARAAVASAALALDAELGEVRATVRSGKDGRVGFDFAGAANRNDVVALDHWPYDHDAVAVTVVTVDNRTHAIIDADIAFDAANRRWEITQPARASGERYDVQNTTTHELGHLAGLAHSEDPEATMYPSTRPADVSKRRFNADDRQALSALYPAAPPSEVGPATGCAVVNGPSLAVLCLLLLTRRLRLAAALLVALPLCAARAEPAIAPSRVAMVATVTSVRTLPPADGATVLQTELWVQVSQCLEARCPTTFRVVMAGGTWGNYTQTVGGAEVPSVGEVVGVTRDGGSEAWARVERLPTPGARDGFVTRAARALRPALPGPALASGK